MAQLYYDPTVYNWLNSLSVNQTNLTPPDWVGVQSYPSSNYSTDYALASMSLPEKQPEPEYKGLTYEQLASIFSNNPNANPSYTVPSFASGGSGNPEAGILADFGDYLAGLKSQGQKQRAMGAGLKTVASAINFFDQLVTWDLRRDNINLTKGNAKQAADNAMLALDNQVLYVKNQLMDRFNTLVANNAVNMAARNLRVSTSTLLEASKETAHDINMDFRTAESNAKLKKIELENNKKQASIAAKYAKTKQFTDFVDAGIELGFNVMTGGGTGQSWGDLFAGF